MKIKLFIIHFAFFLSVFSQSDPNKSKLPEYAPVSPESHSLGTYGNIPVDLSVGKIIMDNSISKKYMKGFNASYLITEHKPKLIDSLLKSEINSDF